MEDRTRTYSWANPQLIDKLGREMDGLEFTRQLLLMGEQGRMPIASTLGFRLEEVVSGRVVLIGELGEHLYNVLGVVHGGVTATLLDTAAASAVHTTVPAGTRYTSLDLSVRFLRPVVSEVAPVRAIGTVLNRGRRTALASAELRDSADRLLATATSTCMLFPPGA
ncbi:PaaI family thioesterase [Actinoplanes sp. NPDC051343]|uniref:PaaI family thioesterase n=1 Tax=Actinoplanes sp. NPDC051343 TaxID=3363906 RepID=UPI0037B04C71